MSRPTHVFLALAVLTLAASARAQVPAAGFVDTTFQGGLDTPTAIAFLPDGRLLVTEKGGALELSDGASATTLVTLGVCSDVEMGLLGVAVDPSFTSNGFIYLYRTDDSNGCGSATGRFNQVVRVTMGPGDTVDPMSLVVLLTGIQTDNGNHDGGVVRVGPDGTLYVGAGDTGLGDNQGGPGTSTNPYAQDLGSLNGKVLRINRDGTIPADNPFVGQAGARPEIFAYGFRNPFRMSFDPTNGNLWVADVGDLTIEEIDIVTAGGNYAWPHCEGTLPAGCENPGDIDPIFTYPHSGGSSLGTCIIGGAFAPASFGGLGGDYFFGDCTANRLYSAVPDGAHTTLTSAALFDDGVSTPADLVFGPDGALYYVAVGGEVGRVAPIASGGDQPVFGSKLAIKNNAANASRSSLSLLAKDGIVLGGTADDPTTAGGTLEVKSADFDETYALPAVAWTAIGLPADRKGFRYKDAIAAAGPVKTAVVRAGKLLKATGRGAALDLALGATSPDPVTVVLTLGTRRYCATFGGTTRFTANKSFAAKLAPTPGACP